MARGRPVLCALALCGIALSTHSLAAQKPVLPGRIPFVEYTLPNGLRVILSPDHSAPVAAVELWFRVGSRDEPPGRMGMAHLFEHLLFESLPNVPKKGSRSLLTEVGGGMSAMTSKDFTSYFAAVPAEWLNRLLWLQADRMRGFVVTPQLLKKEIQVVKEEMRRSASFPYVKSSQAVLDFLPYNAQTCYSYSYNTGGTMESVSAVTLEDVQTFFARHYAPGSAMLVVGGDFDPASVRAMIQQYFGTIPAREVAPRPACNAPFSHLPVRRVIQAPNAPTPAYSASYGTVGPNDPDGYALELLALALSRGEGSRLRRRLTEEEQAASQVTADILRSQEAPAVFFVQAIALQGVGADRLEMLMDQEIEKVRKDGLTATELEQAKKRLRTQMTFSRRSLEYRTGTLLRYAHFKGLELVNSDIDTYMKVTTADVQRVARKYLVPSNRAVVITAPGKANP
jgi:zinc protease